MKNILYRKGSTTYVEDQYGRLWLCKRKKMRRDSRRRKSGAKVIHKSIKLLIDLTYEEEIQFFGKSKKTPRNGGKKDSSGNDH